MGNTAPVGALPAGVLAGGAKTCIGGSESGCRRMGVSGEKEEEMVSQGARALRRAVRRQDSRPWTGALRVAGGPGLR